MDKKIRRAYLRKTRLLRLREATRMENRDDGARPVISMQAPRERERMDSSGKDEAGTARS